MRILLFPSLFLITLHVKAQELKSHWRYFDERTNQTESFYLFENNEMRRCRGIIEWHYAYRNDGVFKEEGDLITVYLQGFSPPKSSYEWVAIPSSPDSAENVGLIEIIVTDHSGDPLEGATININKMKSGGLTNAEGRFLVQDVRKLEELSVFYVGWQGVTVDFAKFCDSHTKLKVTLVESTWNKADNEVGKSVLKRKEKDGRKFLLDLKLRKKYYLISEN